MTPHAGWSGLVLGTASADHRLRACRRPGCSASPARASASWPPGPRFVVDIVVSVVVSLATKPKPDEELVGLVYSLTPRDALGTTIAGENAGWYRKPGLLAGIVLTPDHRPQRHLLGGTSMATESGARPHEAARLRHPADHRPADRRLRRHPHGDGHRLHLRRGDREGRRASTSTCGPASACWSMSALLHHLGEGRPLVDAAREPKTRKTRRPPR